MNGLNENWDVNELIDLFVDLNFEDIQNETLLYQFKSVARTIGYPLEMIDRVVKLGESEYSKLMSEIEQGLIHQPDDFVLS